MQLRDLLRSVRMTVARVTPQTRMFEAAADMSREGRAALLVTENGVLTGVLTCEDVIGWIVDGKASPAREVGSALATRVLTVTPDQSLEEAIAAATAAGTDHLILREGTQVLGLMHVKDLLGEQVRLLRLELENLHDYIDALHTAAED